MVSLKHLYLLLWSPIKQKFNIYGTELETSYLHRLCLRSCTLRESWNKLSHSQGSKAKLNRGEMKILEIMKAKSIVPKVNSIEEVKKKRVELVPKEKYSDLEELTNKSLEFYKFLNNEIKINSSFEKSERIDRQGKCLFINVMIRISVVLNFV